MKKLLIIAVLLTSMFSCTYNEDSTTETCGNITPIRIKDDTKTDSINYVLAINGKYFSVKKEIWEKYHIQEYGCVANSDMEILTKG